MSPQTQEEQVHNMIKTYTHLYKYIFTYVIFVIVIIGAIWKTNNLLGTDASFFSTITLSSKAQIIIEQFQNIQRIPQTDYVIVPYIIQSPLKITTGKLISVNNIIKYQGYILPRYINISTTIQLPQTGLTINDRSTIYTKIILGKQ
jgi:hypothetical protein